MRFDPAAEVPLSGAEALRLSIAAPIATYRDSGRLRLVYLALDCSIQETSGSETVPFPAVSYYSKEFVDTFREFDEASLPLNRTLRRARSERLDLALEAPVERRFLNAYYTRRPAPRFVSLTTRGGA